jgi:hypothetical protein
MKRCFLLLLILLCSSSYALAQKSSQMYAGQETREIKALSSDEVAAYLDGHGMGLAKAAELNHYPGPKHVLELSDKLQLSAQQIAEAQSAYDKMHADAVRLGKEIVERENKLDELFASGAITEEQLAEKVNEISRLQGELRIVHLRAHLAMKKLLSPTQIAGYDKLRGYGQGTEMHQQHDTHHH